MIMETSLISFLGPPTVLHLHAARYTSVGQLYDSRFKHSAYNSEGTENTPRKTRRGAREKEKGNDERSEDES